MAAVTSLYPDNRHYDRRVDPIGVRDLRQGRGIFPPELDALRYALLVQKNLAVFEPGFGFFRRPSNRVQNGLFLLCLCQQTAELFPVELVFFGEVFNEGRGLWVATVIGQCFRREQGANGNSTENTSYF